jgi:hypothetical protein
MPALLIALGLVSAFAIDIAAAVSAPAPSASVAAQPSTRGACSACEGLRLMGQENYPAAMAIFQLSAAKGDGMAMYYIGWMFQRGMGRPPSLGEAARWYRKSLDYGSPEGVTWRGMVYLHGVGVPADYTRAMKLLRNGVAAGDPLGMNEIGFMYQHGLGVTADPAAAWCWYNAAVMSGYDSSRHLRELAGAVPNVPQNCDVVVSMATPAGRGD